MAQPDQPDPVPRKLGIVSTPAQQKLASCTQELFDAAVHVIDALVKGSYEHIPIGPSYLFPGAYNALLTTGDYLTFSVRPMPEPAFDIYMIGEMEDPPG